ncbi:MAG: hypothetical protein RBR35_07870 [Salinivirgaceae bacterium]|nr:hypothetical protein [Salinivirgaceae bacterium]
MKPHYTLIEVARKLELCQRAEVKDVLKQILNPGDDNPELTVSVFFTNPVRLIPRGKIVHGEEDYWSLPAEGSACVTLTGLFDIKVLLRTPIEEILSKEDVKSCRWPDGHGFYPLNSQRPKGLVVVLVQDGIAYELQDKITPRESGLVISRENLELYAERRGITLRPDGSELSKEINPSGDCGEAEVEKEPYTQEEAAALVGTTPETILNLLISRGPHSRPLTPCIFVAGKRASSVREGKEVVLNGYYSVEGIEYVPFDNEEYILSFGGSSRLLLHKGQDTFLLREGVRKKRKDLFVCAEEIDQWVAEIELDTPPMHNPPKNAIKEYIEKRLAEGIDKAEIAAELQERGITHWGVQTKNSPKQWLSQEEAAERMNISPEKLFEEGYLMFPLVYFIEPVQMSYIYSYRSEEKKGIWFDSVKEWHKGFFAIGNFDDLCSPLDGFYQIGNRKASLWLDPSDNEGSYVVEEPLSVHKSELLVAVEDLEFYMLRHGRTGKVGLPEPADSSVGGISTVIRKDENARKYNLPDRKGKKIPEEERRSRADFNKVMEQAFRRCMDEGNIEILRRRNIEAFLRYLKKLVETETKMEEGPQCYSELVKEVKPSSADECILMHKPRTVRGKKEKEIKWYKRFDITRKLSELRKEHPEIFHMDHIKL